MAVYDTTYITPAGDKHRDRVEASNLHELRAVVRKRGGARVLRWRERSQRGTRDRRIREGDLLLFLDLTSIQLRSGIPVLEILDQAKECAAFEKRTKDVLRGVFGQVYDAKSSLSQALEKYPQAFPKEVVTALKVGERGGAAKLAESMKNIWEQRAFKKALRAEALAGSLYPAGLLLGVIGLLVLIFTYLLPKVGELVALGQKAPPDAMLRLLAISHFMHTDGWLLAAGAAAAVAGVLIARRTKKGKRCVARMQLRLPVIGSIVRGYAVADVTKNYRAMYLGGVLPGENLEVCAEATENEAVQAALLRSKDLLENSIIGADGGESPVAEAFRVTGIFPPLAVTIIANGERTATLGEALERVSQIYSDEVRKSIKRTISAYTMGMSLFTAAIVGYVVISVWQTIADISASV